MMKFTHIEHNFPTLQRIDGEHGRVYQTPSGKSYPSVTSVTGLLNKKAIQEWRDRVGAKVANEISTRAAKRGTSIHKLCEDYLSNKGDTSDIFDQEEFTHIKPYLHKINNIHCLEDKLYSDHLGVAGTVDCIAEYEGKLSVIDFKTSSKPKTREMIANYFMQTSAYAVCFEELFGRPIERMLIIMSVKDQGIDIFEGKRDDYIDGFKKLRIEYKQWKGI